MTIITQERGGETGDRRKEGQWLYRGYPESLKIVQVLYVLVRGDYLLEFRIILFGRLLFHQSSYRSQHQPGIIPLINEIKIEPQ